MKKMCFLGTILMLLLVVLVGCGNEAIRPVCRYPGFDARVIYISDNGVVTVEPIGYDDIALLSDRTTFGTAELEDISVSIGDFVTIVYSGTIRDTIPTQIRAKRWAIITTMSD